MKLNAIITAVALAGFASAAFAGNQSRLMQPVTVMGTPIAACTPPSDVLGHACDDYARFVRANFTPREIGMLFGYRSSYPEYLSGGIDSLHVRYQSLLQQYLAAQQGSAVGTASVAAK